MPEMSPLVRSVRRCTSNTLAPQTASRATLSCTSQRRSRLHRPLPAVNRARRAKHSHSTGYCQPHQWHAFLQDMPGELNQDTHVVICGRAVSLVEGGPDDMTMVMVVPDNYGLGEFCCQKGQLTMPVMEALLPLFAMDLPRSLKLGHPFHDEQVKQLTVPMMDFVLRKLISEGNVTTAMELVTHALQNHHEEDSPLVKKAFLHEWRLAIMTGQDGDLDKLRSLEPTDAASLAHAARVNFFAGFCRPTQAAGNQKITGWSTPEAGQQEIMQLQEMLPNDPDILLSCARIKIRLNDSAGVEFLKRADGIRPLEDFHDLLTLGELSSNKDVPFAVSVFDRVLTSEAHIYPAKTAYARVFQQRGACKFTLKQFPAALEDLNMAVKLGLKNAKTFKYRAMLHVHMGNYDAALADMNAAHADDPDDGAVLIDRALTKMQLLDMAGALEDFNAAEQLGPLSPLDIMDREAIKAALHQLQNYI